MRYYATPSTPAVRDAMTAGVLGCIVTPAQGNLIPNQATICADNGCFGKGYPGDGKWLQWLTTLPADRVTFAVAPDVVGNAAATLARSRPWLPHIRALGLPAALVAQDGLEHLPVPWDLFDALFIGGTTTWKLGPHPRNLVREAKAHGKWVHMGRVNSERRYTYAAWIGCDSADGTCLTRGPDANFPRVRAWLRTAPQRSLFEPTALGGTA
jgi:hypothetical protein